MAALAEAPLVASTEVLTEQQLAPIVRLGVPAVVDIHDDTLLQNAALGISTSPEDEAAIRAKDALNRDGFRWLVAPSAPFAALAGLDPARTIVAPNGADSAAVRPGNWPEDPGVGFVAGAAPRRGIEELVEATRIARKTVPDLRLDLVLAATGDHSRAYLDRLQASLAGDDWITIGSSPYPELGARLARATVLAIPTPAHPYWDSVSPVKLFDYFAAGRPVVATPRIETARVVREPTPRPSARDDSPRVMAAALIDLLASPRRPPRRECRPPQPEFDWRVIGRRLADEILARIR